MQIEVVKDKRGFKVGTIEQKSVTTWVANDLNGITLGTYDKLLDRTVDKFGIMISRGNSLVALLYKGIL